MKPGEMQSGGYGFYYKGQQQTPQRDVLQDLQSVITPIETRPRSTEPAKPYKELITSPVYFSNEKWQECLSSHGIIIDEKAKTLTMQSNGANADMVYDLTDEELKALTSNSIKEVPIARRLEVLNNVIKDDFEGKVTMGMLNSKEHIDIKLLPEVEQELQKKNQPVASLEQGLAVKQEMQQHGDASVNGQDVDLHNENKGWYREGAHGREVEVGEIFVEKNPPTEENTKGEATYRMTAIINGEVISHEISQKQYDKFMAVDDYHRMKLFSKVFDEVDMKTRPEANRGLGTKILAALTAGAVVTSEVMHDMGHHHPTPEVYGERFGGPARPYFKPCVDSPQDVAARNFEAQMNRDNSVMSYKL